MWTGCWKRDSEGTYQTIFKESSSSACSSSLLPDDFGQLMLLEIIFPPQEIGLPPTLSREWKEITTLNYHEYSVVVMIGVFSMWQLNKPMSLIYLRD